MVMTEFFPGTAEYCNVNPDPERWKKISVHPNIELKTHGD